MEHKFIRMNADGSKQEIRFKVKHDKEKDIVSIFIFDGDQGTAIEMPRSEFVTLNTLVHSTIKMGTAPHITPGTLTEFLGTDIPKGWKLYHDVGKNYKILEYVGDQNNEQQANSGV